VQEVEGEKAANELESGGKETALVDVEVFNNIIRGKQLIKRSLQQYSVRIHMRKKGI
jgi:hypothetical protein